MRQPLSNVLGIHTPSDGFTPEEQVLEKLIGEQSIEALYHKLPTSRMKAIVAMHFELGYKQETIAHIFSVSQPQIGQEIAYIKSVFLNRPHRAKTLYKPRPHVVRGKRASLTPKDVLELLVHLSRP